MKIGRKILVFSLGLSLAVLMLESKAFALFDNKPTKSTTQAAKTISPQKDLLYRGIRYAPGQIIIKLKENSRLTDIGKLNQKFSIKEIFSLVKDVSSPYKKLEELKQQYQSVKNSKIDKNSLAKQLEVLNNQITCQEKLISRLEFRKKRGANDGKVISDKHLENTYLLKTKKDQNILELIKAYKNHPAVLLAEPNYILTIQDFIPNDPYYDSDNSWGQGYDDLWGLKKLRTQGAWDVSRGDGVLVAVIDTGVDYQHQDLARNMWINKGEISNNNKDDDYNGFIDDYYGYNFAQNNGEVKDGNGHGTHVSGTIAAVGNNKEGIIGVAFGAKIMAIAGLDQEGGGTEIDLANSIYYAVDNGAEVINASWGGRGYFSLIAEAIRYAIDQGCVFVAAAGNSNANANDFCPANVEDVITVAASSQEDKKCFFSNYGRRIDISAPGGNSEDNPYNILSVLAKDSLFEQYYKALIVGDKYIRLAGTSMAAPHIAGVCALILSKYPLDKIDNVRARIKLTAEPLKEDYQWNMGTGRVNASSALKNTSIPSPYFEIKNIELLEIKGDGDQIPETDEIIALSITLKNIWQDGVYVKAKIETNDPSIKEIVKPEARFGSIAYGETKGNQDNPFILKLSNIDYDTQAAITISIDAYGFAAQKIKFPIYLGIRRINYLKDIPASGPYINNDKIVWSDTNKEGICLHIYDLVKNQEAKIATESSVYNPVVTSDIIAWQGYIGGQVDLDVFAFDLKKQQELRITNNYFWQTFVTAWGTKLLWSDDRNEGVYNLYLFDLKNPQEIAITQGSENHWYPSIWENKLVWFEYYPEVSNFRYQIFIHDLLNQETKLLSPSRNSQLFPVISKDKITWQEYTDEGGYDIFYFNLANQEKYKITDDPSDQLEPFINDNIIVWTDTRGDNYNIFAYDITTGKEIQITKDSNEQILPTVYNGKIVWLDNRDGRAIYMTDLKKVRS